MINCLIIDDEPLARERVLNLVNENEQLNCLDEAKTGKSAIRMINELSPDLIFLDIQMKDMNGFQVLKKIKEKPVVVFITAYDNYAIKAFEHYAIDYLLKPFKKERFKESVNRALEYLSNKEQSGFKNKLNNLLENTHNLDIISEGSINKRIPIKIGKSIFFIETNTIKYILASGSYIDIVTIEKTYTLRSSLNDILEKIGSSKFVRIHRSTIINIDYIDKLLYSNFGEIDTKMKDGNLYRVSQGYKGV